MKSHILHTPTTTTTTTDHRCCSIGNRLGSTTFRLGSEHERKMPSITRGNDACRGGSMMHVEGVYDACRERVNPIFSSVLSQNSKLLVIAQLHPRSTEHLMSNIHLHNTIQHAFAALMQVQTSHLCIVILSRTSCTHHHQQRRRQWIIFAVPTETKLGSTTFRFGSEHQRKMSSIDPATQQSRLCESRRSVILLMEDSRVIGVFCWRLIFAFCGRALC